MITENNNQGGTMGPALKLKNDFQDKNLAKVIKLIVGIFIFVLAVVMIPYFIPQPEPNSQVVKNNGQQEIVKSNLPKIIYNIVGFVKKIDKNSFILKASIPWIDEGGQLTQKTEERKVNITSATRITRLTFIAQEGSKGKTPVETPTTFNGIKIDDYLEVISNIDISQALEFEATQVRFLPQSF